MDIAFYNKWDKIAVIIEIKNAKDKESLDALVKSGMKQIDVRNYGISFTKKNYDVIKYSIAFYKKVVRVLKVD